MKQWFIQLTKKRWVMHAALLVILAVVLFFPAVTHAGGFAEGVAKFFGHLVAAIIWLLGKLLVLIIYLVVQVATYNDFINSAAVDAGWEIVRDVCNMFFILLLLIIAFGTILNIKEYHWKHALPKLLLMAVLINFSKLICGVIIDFAQVVMLTFVNGFRDIAGGNLADMAGIMDLLNVNAESGDVGVLSLAGTYFLALIYIVVALIVMGVILFVLIMRIIMLWILVVLSPLAYLLSSTEKTKTYAGQWWKQFGDNVVAGPLLAFFIWLSFAALQQGDVAEDFGRAPDQGADTEYYSAISGAAGLAPQGASAGLATAGTPNGMLKFIISMGMLLGGLMMTKQLSGAVGEIAGKGLDMSSKAIKSMTGFNAVKDRVGAFNKQREAARSEKINAFGDKLYGKYASVQGGIKGGLRGAVAGTKGVVKDVGSVVGTTALNKMATSNSKILQSAAAKIKAIPAGVQGFRSGRADYKKKKRENFDRLRDAYENGVYTDEHDNKFTEHWENGQTFYVQKDANNNITKYATKDNGETITKLSKTAYSVDKAWTKSMVESRAYNNKKEKERVEKDKDQMTNAGLTTAQLLGTLNDASTSSSKKIAVALAIAVKEGFKNKDQVSRAQTALTNINNPLLTKQFNDDVDKKQAHLNYDLETEVGRKKFAKRRADGKFDVLEASAYKDANVIRALSDSMTDKEFVRYMDKVSAYSSKHNGEQETGLRAHLDDQTPAIDPVTKKADKARLVAPRVTKNLNDSVRGINDAQLVEEVIESVFQDMSLGDIAKLKPESLKPDTNFPAHIQQAYANALTQVIKQLESSQIEALKRNREANRETVKKIEEINTGGRSSNDDPTSAPKDKPSNRRPGPVPL